MNQESNPRELPTKRRTVLLDDAVRKSLSQLAKSTGLTNNLTLHALLNCFDACDDFDSASEYAKSYDPGPTKPHVLLIDKATFKRFRDLAATLRSTSNVALAVLLECYREHPGPIRVEGAGLRVPCPIGAPCAPDAPSAGPAAAKHVAPTRLRAGMSACPAIKASGQDGPDVEKAALLQALIDEEGTKTNIYRKSAALLSALSLGAWTAGSETP